MAAGVKGYQIPKEITEKEESINFSFTIYLFMVTNNISLNLQGRVPWSSVQISHKVGTKVRFATNTESCTLTYKMLNERYIYNIFIIKLYI